MRFLKKVTLPKLLKRSEVNTVLNPTNHKQRPTGETKHQHQTSKQATKPSQNKPTRNKPHQTKPNHTKPYQTKSKQPQISSTWSVFHLRLWAYWRRWSCGSWAVRQKSQSQRAVRRLGAAAAQALRMCRAQLQAGGGGGW